MDGIGPDYQRGYHSHLLFLPAVPCNRQNTGRLWEISLMGTAQDGILWNECLMQGRRLRVRIVHLWSSCTCNST